jgi:hypothetical protein
MLDDILLFVGEPGTNISTVTFDFDDSHDVAHLLSIRLSGKLPEHTEIDEDGNIIEDRTVKISNMKFDDIELGQVFFENCKYKHDFNGTQEPVIEKFHGVMGCNGTVELEFSTPIYMWLLENM